MHRPGQTTLGIKVNVPGLIAGYESAFTCQLGCGPGGGPCLTAFNTASGHLRQLSSLVDALGNGNITLINQFGQAYAKATGSAAPTNFDTVRNAAVGEVAKLFSGGVVAQAEREEIEAPLKNSGSPAQLKQAVDELRHLMESRKAALKNQFEQAKQGQPAFDSPESKTDPFAQFGGKAR